jgi:hypothetical protein
MLLNEVQQQRRRLVDQEARLAALEAALAAQGKELQKVRLFQGTTALRQTSH